jgi:hypothetical protein
MGFVMPYRKQWSHKAIGVEYRRKISPKMLKRRYHMRVKILESGKWEISLLPPSNRRSKGVISKNKVKASDGMRLAKRKALRYRVPEENVEVLEWYDGGVETEIAEGAGDTSQDEHRGEVLGFEDEVYSDFGTPESDGDVSFEPSE